MGGFRALARRLLQDLYSSWDLSGSVMEDRRPTNYPAVKGFDYFFRSYQLSLSLVWGIVLFLVAAMWGFSPISKGRLILPNPSRLCFPPGPRKL